MNEKMYKAVIIDDERHCIERITHSLSNYPEITIAGAAGCAKEGSVLIMQIRPELIFADVEMPGESGLDMIRNLEPRMNWNVHVVFHTAYNHYLLDALRTSAFDFLLKPYQDCEFNCMMQRWFMHLNRENVVHKSNGNPGMNNERRFMISTDEGFQLCKTEHFVYAEYISNSKIWSVKLSNESTAYLKRGTKAEDILNLACYFIQISQYCIVNCNYLLLTKNDYCEMIPPFDKYKLKITRKYLKEFHVKFEGI